MRFIINILAKYKIHHIAFWIIFYFLFVNLTPGIMLNQNVKHEVALLNITAFALSVYLINYVIIPFFVKRKKYFLLAIYIIIHILIVGTLIYKGTIYFTSKSMPAEEWQIIKAKDDVALKWLWSYLFFGSYISLFIVVLVGVLTKFILNYILAKRNAELLEKEKIIAELEALKAQINPHFLFNALNTIYFKIERNNVQARELVAQFTDILRYQLYECNSDAIDISKEIHYLKSFISIFESRKEDNFNIEFDFDENLNGYSIAPFLLLPLVENAFKHSSQYLNKENVIKIALKKDTEDFIFSTYNTKENTTTLVNKETAGIGLKNVKRRLELLYPQKHNLEIENCLDYFSLKLKIRLFN